MQLPSLSTFNPFAQKSRPVEADPVDLEMDLPEPTAPLIEEIEATVSQEAPTNKFEWNVEKLFAHDPKHSLGRTWAVRLLGLFIGVPTLILDLGRRLAFSVGLVNGKSFSLIDSTSDACKAVAASVGSALGFRERTLEEKNEHSVQEMRAHAKELVEGFEKLNGGRFHTNSSFSSPYALEGAAQIDKATADLWEDVHNYVMNNAESAEGFVDKLKVAEQMMLTSVVDASKGKYFVPNKVVHSAIPMAQAIFEKLDSTSLPGRKKLAEKFIDVASRDSNYVDGLKKGIEFGIVNKLQAKQALASHAQEVYSQALETGVKKAEKTLNNLMESAMRENIVSRSEAVQMSENIQPSVEVLAVAAAKDVARKTISEDVVPAQLIKISDDLQKVKRLSGKDVSRFLNEAKARVDQIKQQLGAQKFKTEEDAAKIEAERLAEVQKSADQQSLFGKFTKMLNLIANRQSDLTAKFNVSDALENDRKRLSEQLETIRNTKVKINGQETTVLQAADKYYASLSLISRSKLTVAERKERMDALADEGFTKATIDRIQELKSLDPKLMDVIDRQASLAREIEENHNELTRLRGVFHVFKKHNFNQLGTDNRKAVVDEEVQVNKAQKTLNDRLGGLLGKTNIIGRLRVDQTSIPVNHDPVGNRAEVDALITEFEKAGKDGVVELGAPRPFYARWANNMMHPLSWIRG